MQKLKHHGRKLKASTGKIKEKGKEIEKQFRKQTIKYILGGLGLVAGLAWNEAIKSIIDHFFPGDKETIWAKLGYAFLVTIVVVILGIYINKLFKEAEKTRNR